MLKARQSRAINRDISCMPRLGPLVRSNVWRLPSLTLKNHASPHRVARPTTARLSNQLREPLDWVCFSPESCISNYAPSTISGESLDWVSSRFLHHSVVRQHCKTQLFHFHATLNKLFNQCVEAYRQLLVLWSLTQQILSTNFPRVFEHFNLFGKY